MDSFFEIPSVHHRSRRNLTNQQRQLIFEMLLMKVQQGKLKRGSIPEVAAAFGANPKTVRRIWKRAMACFTNGLAVDVSSKLPTHVGRKPNQFDVNRIAEIDLRQRTSLRSLSMALNVPKTTLYRRVKKGHIRPHTNALKPYLSDDHKRARLRFCLAMLEPSSLYTQPTFKNMYNYVHIDEKWFFMTKEAERYYLLPEEHEPLRTCKSKRFITKVMFLAAVARPRYDPSRNQEFSGKIGIFPFTFTEPAKRRSKNRAAGTLETKAVIRVTKEIIRTCLIENVLPAIRAKWPRCIDGETIFIQQDNARPHVHEMDPEFIEAASKDGFDIRLSFQPPNSPDLNVLDLGFFRAIQSLQYQQAPKTIDDLVSAVKKSFEELSSESLNHVFLTLQTCMVEVMKVYGRINYKVPHMGKNRLERNGNLPIQIQCELDVVEKALDHLQRSQQEL